MLKRYEDGTTVYVEEKRNRHKELAAVTMWKMKSPALNDANRTETTLIPHLGETSDRKGEDNSAISQGPK